MAGMTALVVLSNAVPGRGEELRAWYDEVHLPDARRIPGVAAARRYETAAVDGMPGATHAFMAVYELDGDLRPVSRRLLSGGGPERV